jgi:DnaK suppressor protein
MRLRPPIEGVRTVQGFTKVEVGRFRAELERRLAEIELADAREPPESRTGDSSGAGGPPRIDALRRRVAVNAHIERLASEQRRVEAALDRIASRRYGICCRCDGAISIDRLNGDPATAFCAGCLTQLRQGLGLP